MPRKKEIPNKPRFSFAASRAYELLVELDICSFPVDPKYIISQFSNWQLAGYLELQIKTGHEDPLNIRREQAEAKTIKIRADNDYLIVYDEQVQNSSRIRWTLAHEIGHIVLGHLDHFEATALNRRGLSKKAYGVLEVEAHWFAAELLSPKPILKLFQFEDCPDLVSLMCDISKEAAEKRLAQLAKRDYGYVEAQGKLIRNFYSYCSTRGYLASIFNTANRYQNSRIYPDLCKHSRVCYHCNAFIEESGQRFCHICGCAVPAADRYSPLKVSEGFFYIGYDFMYEGKYFPEIQTSNDNRVLFCPVCKNHEFSDNTEYCRICGTTLYNKCKSENKTISGYCRYCPDCGAKAEFKELYDSFQGKVSRENFISSHIDLDDYIDYEYWDYICMTIMAWEKNANLFTALADSSAFRDGDDIVVLVKTDNESNIVNSNLEVILHCLQRHGFTSVKNVRCFSVL